MKKALKEAENERMRVNADTVVGGVLEVLLEVCLGVLVRPGGMQEVNGSVSSP